jgi:hypothetical protein
MNQMPNGLTNMNIRPFSDPATRKPCGGIFFLYPFAHFDNSTFPSTRCPEALAQRLSRLSLSLRPPPLRLSLRPPPLRLLHQIVRYRPRRLVNVHEHPMGKGVLRTRKRCCIYGCELSTSLTWVPIIHRPGDVRMLPHLRLDVRLYPNANDEMRTQLGNVPRQPR